MGFFLEVLVGGLLAGVMYSMVAIGFVLIYKASGVFNFAQDSMVLFGALTYVSLVERHVHPVLAFAITLAALVLIALLIGRLVLRPLENRPPMMVGTPPALGCSVMMKCPHAIPVFCMVSYWVSVRDTSVTV